MIALIKYLNRLRKQSPQEIKELKEKEKADKLHKAIVAMEQGATKLSGWSLSVIGGSLLTIIADSYLHPNVVNYKLVYLLFVAGWVLLAVSLYYGFLITRSSMVTDLYNGKADALQTIFSNCNKYFKRQLDCFQWGLVLFGIWLVLYLLWWVFIMVPVKK